jgi:predicted dehydrogenase
MLFTAGIHALDRLVWLMDAKVEAVAAMSATLFHDQQVADTDQLLLRFAGGGLGQVASIATGDLTMLNTTEIICEGGTLALDLATGLRLGRAGRWEDVPGAIEPDWPIRGLQREWHALLAAIASGRSPEISGPEISGHAGGELVAVIEAARHAATTGTTVPVAW